MAAGLDRTWKWRFCGWLPIASPLQVRKNSTTADVRKFESRCCTISSEDALGGLLGRGRGWGGGRERCSRLVPFVRSSLSMADFTLLRPVSGNSHSMLFRAFNTPSILSLCACHTPFCPLPSRNGLQYPTRSALTPNVTAARVQSQNLWSILRALGSGFRLLPGTQR